MDKILKIIEEVTMKKCRYCGKELDSNLEFCSSECENSYRKIIECKLRSNGMPVPLLRNGYSIFNGTKYR